MVFNSFHFLVFFIVVTSVYFSLNHKCRWFWLLGSSCYFYMAFVPVYILILGFTIVIDYFAGIFIENAKGKRRKLFLFVSLAANIGVLSVFKYYNFINENLSVLLNGFGVRDPLPYLSILLPIGLSFHTFQAMSYTIEVYKGNYKAERKFGIFALYVMFYPQLVAGPIERPQNLLHQFYEKHIVNYQRIVDGLKQMAWGIFKKVVIADRIGVIVDHAYSHPENYRGITFIIAIFFFAFQLYCDFSGYSDIALGAARVMGFNLMKNFDLPFTSKSITEFWRRWHISLSTWFNDYVFKPFVTETRDWGKMSVVSGLFITFFLSGLWHGAGWQFVVFGCLHGVALIYEFLTKKFRKKMSAFFPTWFYNSASTVIVFWYASFAWIFFRARTIHDGIYIATHLTSGLYTDLKNLILHHTIKLQLGISKKELLIGIIAIGVMELIQILQQKVQLAQLINKQPALVRWSIYYAVFFIILIYGVFENRQFIYFQF